MKTRPVQLAMAVFLALPYLGIPEHARAEAFDFDNISCSYVVLLEHPGLFPAGPAGGSRPDETLIEELERTGDRDEYHAEMTYHALNQLQNCISEINSGLRSDARKRDNRLDRIEEQLERIIAILDRIS